MTYVPLIAVAASPLEPGPIDVYSCTDRKGPFIRSIEAKAMTED